MKRMQRLGSAALAAAMLLGASVAAAEGEFTRIQTYAQGQFTDVGADAWYASSVKDCYELGLMNGSGAHTFSPDGMFTIAEGLTIAARLNDLYGGGSGQIPAADGQWYQGAVNYCTEKGIIRAGEYTQYEKNATRAEMAGILAAALPGQALAAKNDIAKLPDVTAATQNSASIFLLYNAGVVGGSDEYGTFQPNASITRAEVSAIVDRMAQPSMRKTLKLTPVEEQGAPVLPAGAVDRMRGGRIVFKENGKFGYLDASGKAVIPAQYKEAEDFRNGYARVVTTDRKFAVIDPNGQYVVAPGTDTVSELGHDLFAIHKSSGTGVVDRTGKTVVPFEYDYQIEAADDYIVAHVKDTKEYQFFTLGGQKLQRLKLGSMPSGGQKLFAIEENGKYALYSAETGRLTDAVYDSIFTSSDAELVTLKIGNTVGLAGPNGIILEPGKYESIQVKGKLAAVKTDTGYELATFSGLTGVSLGESNLNMHSAGSNVVITQGEIDKPAVFDEKGAVIGKSFVTSTDGIPLGKAFQASDEYQVFDRAYYIYQGLDGSYCVMEEKTGEIVGTGFSNEKEARNYCTSGKALGKIYWIGNNESGKPVVYYGVYKSPEDSELVISEYKTGVYYDKLTYIGEGCLIGQYGDQKYLLHV